MPTPVILVTGASTGIGAAAVRRLDRAGYTVLAGVRRAEDGERLRAGASDRLYPIRLDVTSSTDIGEAAAAVESLAGSAGLRGLVNNAGIAVGGPLEFVPLDQFREQFEVNVFGLLAVTQAMLPSLRRAPGRIVNVGSIAGTTVTPMVGPYSASKHALEAINDGLRLELASAGIRVAIVEPGPVRTPIWAKGQAVLERAAELYPARALELYGDQIALIGRLAGANASQGMTPEPVVDAVIHALEAERPRTRYLVGRSARVRLALRRLLPDRAMDAFIHRYLRRMARDGR